MPFSETLKANLRARADHKCCVCETINVDIHHIVPQAEGGPDTEDNAAPLCPNCHDTLGANPQKRKFIRERKDAHLKKCAAIFENQSTMAELRQIVGSVATRGDVEQLRDMIAAVLPKSRSNRGDVVLTVNEYLAYLLTGRFSGITRKRAPDERLRKFYCDTIFRMTTGFSDDQIATVRIFTERFGTEIAGALAEQIAFEIGFSADGFTETQFSELCAVSVFAAESLLLFASEKGRKMLECRLRADGMLVWRATTPATSREPRKTSSKLPASAQSTTPA